MTGQNLYNSHSRIFLNTFLKFLDFETPSTLRVILLSLQTIVRAFF